MAKAVKEAEEVNLDFLDYGYGEFLELAKAVNFAVQYILEKNFEDEITSKDLFSLCLLLDIVNEKLDELSQKLFETAENLILKEVK